MMGTRLLFRVWLVWMGRTKRERDEICRDGLEV